MCYFVPCKVLLIFKRACVAEVNAHEFEHDAVRFCHKISQNVTIESHLSLGAAAGAPVTQINLAVA